MSEENNGSGFTSMYLELDTTRLTASTVFAYFSFFIYNKKTNKYFTIQDLVGKQFNALTPGWGCPQALMLDTFSDPKEGYVFNGGQCEFVVDVMVALNNWEVVSFSPEPSYLKFSWTANKFSKLKDECYVSDKFFMGGKNCVIKLYPKGISTTYSKYISIFVYLADSETMKEGEQINTRGDLQILDPFGYKHKTKKFNNALYSKSKRSLGWCKFMSLDELGDAYLDKKGSLNIVMEFEALSTTSSYP